MTTHPTQEISITKVPMIPHTVYMLMGPSGAGKSTLVERLVSEVFTEYDGSDASKVKNLVSVINADGWRGFFANTASSPRTHKMEPSMRQVSGPAFRMLEAELEQNMAFPIATPYIFVDTRGLGMEFRQNVKTMADRYGYNFVLVSLNLDRKVLDQTPFTHGSMEKTLRHDDFARVHKEMSDIGIRDFTAHVRIRNRLEHWDNVQMEGGELVDTHKKIIRAYKPNTMYAVIGDVHESVQALKELVAKIDNRDIEHKQLIFVGDYLDKGGDTEGILKLMTELVEKRGAWIVHANHEKYIYGRLKGTMPEAAHEEKWIDSLKVLYARPDLQEMFFNLYENHSVPSIYLTGLGYRDLYVTHVPCSDRDLGRVKSTSRNRQSNLYLGDGSVDPRTMYEHLYKEVKLIHPYHCFGHVCHSEKYVSLGNKYFLDTGAVHGGRLTAFCYAGGEIGSEWIMNVDAPVLFESSIPKNRVKPIPVEKPFHIDNYNLSDYQQRAVKRFVKSPASFISGTMSPSASIVGDPDKGTVSVLEPIRTALEYFKGKGVKKVLLDPKFMGSRITLVLDRDNPENSIATMRTGNRTNKVHDPLIARIAKEQIALADKQFGTEWKFAHVDGELTPWSVIGSGLIEREFYQYAAQVRSELEELADDPVFAQLEIGKEFDVQTRLGKLDEFDRQLQIHGHIPEGEYDPQDPKIKFNAFGYLKVDDEIFGSVPHLAHFDTLGRTGYCIVDLEDMDSAVSYAQGALYNVVMNDMEGFVVKPLEAVKGCLPFMKVRNEQYLRIIYGYDYDLYYEHHCRKKSIDSKAKVSLKEYEMGLELLGTTDPDKKLELAVKLIAEMNREEHLDPRL